MASETKTQEPEPGSIQSTITTTTTAESSKDSSPSKSSKSSKPKEEKKKYPEIRKQLFDAYGLSIRDHFIRACYAKYQTNTLELDQFFDEAIYQTLTSIGEPYLPTKFTSKQKKLQNKSLLQIFNTRDVSKSLHTQNQLNSGNEAKRMLHFTLTDGKTKINAIEYQHVARLDNRGIYPGCKIQIEKSEIRNGVLLLRPSNVLWIGGEVESFKNKYVATIKSREGDTRVHQKNLLKNETPPPKFEANDLTAPVDEKYNENDDEYNDQYDEYEAPSKTEIKPQAQAQPQSNTQAQGHVQGQGQGQGPGQGQMHGQGHGYDNDYYENEAYYNEQPPQQQPQQQSQQRYKNKNDVNDNSGAGVGGDNNNWIPNTLAQLYSVKELPYTADIVAEIVSAVLQFNNQSHDAFIEFDISDSTGKCKGMTSPYLMQWICSQYGQQIDQQMVDAFFKQWGRTPICIKMELKHPQRMVIFHEIKWQGGY